MGHVSTAKSGREVYWAVLMLQYYSVGVLRDWKGPGLNPAHHKVQVAVETRPVMELGLYLTLTTERRPAGSEAYPEVEMSHKIPAHSIK